MTGPPGWDPDDAAERIRAKAQAERFHYAHLFASLRTNDRAETEREAEERIRAWDERIASARRLLLSASRSE
jgi:hypothetical protein